MVSRTRIVPALTPEARLKRSLRRHLNELGFERAADGGLVLPGDGKEAVRRLHAAQRAAKLRASGDFLERHAGGLLPHFAAGADVDVARIRPALQRVRNKTWEADLFRLAALTWSVPVSNGFGRRLRYLVWDEANGKLIGILAIGDPVFNLTVRDRLVGWDARARSERLVGVMDAYVVGALPPYSLLLGGKLVACLLRTREVYEDFASAYGDTVGIISGREKKARLLAITTSSSMGRSSLYNRLKLAGSTYFRPIGYTDGWGHFHIPDDLFEGLRAYLRAIDHDYADGHRFGGGPNWRLRTTRAALAALGIRGETLKHGVRREVFLCETAANSLALLRGQDGGEPDIARLLTVPEVGGLAVERWMAGRAERRPEFRSWRAAQVLDLFAEGLRGRGRQLSLPC